MSKPEVPTSLTDTFIEVGVFIELGVFVIDEFSTHLLQYCQLKVTYQLLHIVFFSTFKTEIPHTRSIAKKVSYITQRSVSPP